MICENRWRSNSHFVSIVILCLLLCACSGNEPWRYDPGAPDQPAGLAATADNGKVALNWPAANNAAAYNIYYSTSPGVSRATGTKSATVAGTSYIQTGLTNGTTYYFVVTAVNSNSESAESSQVAATPASLGSYAQGDLTGVWNFNILVSGAEPGWMRGSVSVDTAGAVTFNSFLDSTGHTLPPDTLFPKLFVGSSGQIRDTNAAVSNFQGVMAANRKMIVGNASPDSASQLMAILQKQVPGVTFSDAGDLQGFGNAGGGGRRFIYNQISSGYIQEWEYAAGKIGRDQKIEYTTFTAPSHPATPGNKASMLNITPDGIVTESLTGVVPQPAAVIGRGVMSADKSVIIGTATDTSGTSPRYILRIYQFVNMIPNDPNTFTAADLAGTYDLRILLGGASSLLASGTISMNDTGTAAYSSFNDSNGGAALPPDFSLAMDTNGNLSNVADSTVIGKLSYFKDMFVVTGTDFTGACSLSIALKR